MGYDLKMEYILTEPFGQQPFYCGRLRSQAERAMYRDQDSFPDQDSYRDQNSETEAHLPALLENQSRRELLPAGLPFADTDDYSEPAPRRVSLWPAFDRRTLIVSAAAIAIGRRTERV